MADPHALPGFGEVDLDLGDDGEEDAPPASTSRASGQERVAKPTVRRDEDEPIPEEARDGEATRIVASNAISAYTRSKPPPGKSIGEQPTRMGSLDDLVAQSRDASESGIATRDDRVAAMREAYARGDAAAALELAHSMRGEPGVATPPTGDHPDASICVQVAGEVEIEEEAYGGLIPIEEGTVQLEIKSVSEPPAEGVDVVRSALTLTERQSIPRVVLGPKEIGKLPIDARGGFLLSQVDGMQTLEEILDVCAMPAEEALAVFDQLKSLGVIEFD